jgi:D-alanyl-D-alanine carboxypeptidase (penicillin-binding protein 5/6)
LQLEKWRGGHENLRRFIEYREDRKKGETAMKKLVAALCAVVVLTTGAHALDVTAPSALLMEKETGTVLFSKNEHEQLEPASVTKVMTLLLTMEAIDSGQLGYDDMITGSAHACSMGGSQIWLKEGEQLSVSDMLKAVCVVSANDCAVALGEHLAGSEDAFVECMNQRAKELGMNDTCFKNATGLPAAGHVTSAYDIALMSRELILKHPAIRQYTTIWMDTLRDGTSSLVNTNKLVRFYPGTTGLKTGSTDSAGFCISATAEKDGMELIAVIMKDPTSPQRQEDAKTLLSYGFSTYALTNLTADLALAPVPVHLGMQETVQPVLAESSVLLEKAKATALEKTLNLPQSINAPVQKGDVLGTLTVTSDGEAIGEVPILAGEDVPRLTWGQMTMRLLRTAFLCGKVS